MDTKKGSILYFDSGQMQVALFYKLLYRVLPFSRRHNGCWRTIQLRAKFVLCLVYKIAQVIIRCVIIK